MSATTIAAQRAGALARWASTTFRQTDWAYLAAQAGQLGPLLRQAGRGQARIWKWPLVVAIRFPAPAAALAALHIVGAGLLAGVLRRVLPIAPGWLFIVALAVVAVVVGLLAAPPGPARADNRWFSEGRLVTALLHAGVLPAPRRDEPMPTLSRRGQPEHTDRGTSVTVALPMGRTAADVVAARERLSGSLGICADRLRVAHVTGKPANVCKLTELAPRPSGTTPAEVGAVDRTKWSDPVRIGETDDGRPVRLDTHEANVMLAGIPGSGKTSVARVVLGHYLLDPAAQVFGLDGKGSRRDYGAAVPMCTRWVWGTDEGAVAAVEELLGEVLAIVRQRNASEDAEQWPGVLVLLEEYQDVRAAADKAGRERLDSLLGRVVRMGRAVGVAVLVSTQRPSVDDLPSGVRNLVSQRLALQLRNGADAALVLGMAPDLPLPRRRGEGLLTTPTGTSAVQLDLLDDTAWTALCRRATALRGNRTREAPQGATGPASELPGLPADEALSPVQAAAFELLTVEADGLPADLLRALLPEDVRPANAARLGRELSSRPDRFAATRDRDGRRWTAVTPAVTPSSVPVTDPGFTRDDSRNTPHMRPAPVLPSAPTAAPHDDDPLDWARLPSRADLDRQENSS